MTNLFHDKKANNSCNLAFIIDDLDNTINFAANEVEDIKDYEMVDDSIFYKGNGALGISIRNLKTNEVIGYTVIYSYDELTSTTNYKIISDNKK